MNNAERKHIEKIKHMPWCICSESSPSDAHHVLCNGRRVSHYLVIPLCKSCHQDNQNGIHGNKAMWSVFKMNELDAIAKTIGNL